MKRQREKIFVSNPLANATGKQYSGNYMQGGKVIGTQRQLPTYGSYESSEDWEKKFPSTSAENMVFQNFFIVYHEAIKKELANMPTDAVKYLNPYDLSSPEVRGAAKQGYIKYFTAYPWEYLGKKIKLAGTKVDNQSGFSWSKIVDHPDRWKVLAKFYIPSGGNFESVIKQIYEDMVEYKGGVYFTEEYDEQKDKTEEEAQQEQQQKQQKQQEEQQEEQENNKKRTDTPLLLIGAGILAILFMVKGKSR